MGKRKDRRQTTGRRVKLDLFADPSEDSSKLEEIGGDNLDNIEQIEIHNPSSPPAKPEAIYGKKGNPLLLLGQYSDEESEEELEMSNDANMEVEDSTAESNKTENSIVKQSPTNVQPVKTDNLEGQNEKITKETHTNIQNSISQSQTCETQITASGFGHWKTLIHEETNQYYYWNTLTGETSWELPPGVVPVPESVPVLVPVKEAANQTGTDLVGNEGAGFVEGTVPVEDSVPVERQVAESERDVNVGTDFKADFDPEQLVKFGEDLLKRLAPLEGSFDKIGAIRKEIEIRVSDCKALCMYGSSLLPFWFHTETKLKLLEASVSEAQETFSLSKTSQNTQEERERSNNPLVEKETIKEEDNEMLLLPSTENLGNEKDKQEIENEKEKEKEREKEEDKIENETVIKPINTDVEMEVEEESTPNVKIINEKTDLPLLEEGEIPDPTSDAWVPPPPPEDEPVPPPPEDEPIPVPPPPPEELVPIPPPPPEEELVPVPPPPPPEEELVPVPPPPPPEEEVSVSYTSELLVSYSSYVEPVPVPASSYQTYVGLPTYDFGASYQSYPQPSYYETVPYYTVPATVPVPAPVPVQNNPVEPTGTEVQRSVPNDGTVSDVGPTNEISVQIAEAYSKTQNKVIKGKKRASAVAPTMRSNKKVAGLVNKWKAASEELHVEPESAIEILEKKRQRAIEEWKANQIASGEAQDNANFVPLGGDWREKVKKRQAKKAKKENSQTSSETDNNNNNNNNNEDKKQEIKQPDLAKFSIGLPSGWQAYWDESSKQVYYGNVKTSETSWDRPK